MFQNLLLMFSFFLMFFLIIRLLLILIKKISENFFYYFFIIIVVFIITTIIIFPGESVDAAYDGLIVWTTLVLPALLPFFIGTEVLIDLGVVRFLGVLLEPIMRPIFNVPGEGSFAFAMSITSGYPVGSKIVSKLRSDKTLSKVEAQRLISFCSTSGPLFMIGSVAVGMFKSSNIGILIAASHYIAAIMVGILFSFYKSSIDNSRFNRPSNNLFKRAFKQINRENGKNLPIGVILGNSVKNSLNSVLIVGGFIILFSVIIRMLDILNIIDFITSILATVLIPFKISPIIIRSFITGLFEVTTGAKMVVDSINMDLRTKIALTSFIIGWSGFSIHAQILSFIGKTDIKPSLYFLSKVLHGIFSLMITYFIFPFFEDFFIPSLPVFNSYKLLSFKKKFLFNFKLSAELFISILISLLIVSLLATAFLKVQMYFINKKGMK